MSPTVTSATSWIATFWSISPPLPAEDGAPPHELQWLTDGPWAVVWFLALLAIVVLWFGRRAQSNDPSRPRRRAPIDLDVARMDSLPRTAIAAAKAGPCHVEAVIHSAHGSLGGEAGHECVYRNLARGDRATAVAAELVLVADESGRCALENLDRARVIAPKEGPKNREFVALYVGDRVQVLGRFAPEHVGDDADPTTHVYGGFGADGYFQVRLVERGRAPASDGVGTSRDHDKRPAPPSNDTTPSDATNLDDEEPPPSP